jgi:hypothetical protein
MKLYRNFKKFWNFYRNSEKYTKKSKKKFHQGNTRHNDEAFARHDVNVFRVTGILYLKSTT